MVVVALSLLLALPTFVLRPSATGYKLSGFMHPRCARHNPFRLAASDEHDDNLSDEDTEELLFQFDSAGKQKAWVLQPHLRNMVEDLKKARRSWTCALSALGKPVTYPQLSTCRLISFAKRLGCPSLRQTIARCTCTRRSNGNLKPSRPRACFGQLDTPA